MDQVRGGGRQQRGQTVTAVVDKEDTQDQVADYIGEGTMVASNAGDSGVAMMAAMVEDSGGR
jgi:hypothetical protein